MDTLPSHQRHLPYELQDRSLIYLTRFTESKIRTDIVHRQRSEVQASLRSRGMALAATMTDKNERE
eukprot:2104898-Amphidinium_carterae.1